MDKNGWNVGEAKQQFSELLKRSERHPQLIYRRNRLVAAVVAVDEANVSAITGRITIAERFQEARELFKEEKASLPVPRRRSRRNEFVRTIDALADGHKRPQ